MRVVLEKARNMRKASSTPRAPEAAPHSARGGHRAFTGGAGGAARHRGGSGGQSHRRAGCLRYIILSALKMPASREVRVNRSWSRMGEFVFFSW